MSVTDTSSRLESVSRWEPGTADRLRVAALRLFAKRGYSATTAADIAAEAGVTERTFFRHFTDKEEVLFDDDARLETLILIGMRSHLGDDHSTKGAFEAALGGMRALAADFDGDRASHRARARVLAQVPALLGRQLLKQERWTSSVRSALVAGGVDRQAAAVGVELAAVSMRLAYSEWLGTTRRSSLVTHLDMTARLVERASA